MATFTQVRRALIASATAVIALTPQLVLAVPLTSSHYRLDPNVSDSFGGLGSSTDYRLTDAGGEAAVGASSSGSYRLAAGYIAGLAQSIQLTILPSGLAAYYPLDTGQGTQVYDVTANNNQGALTATPSWITAKLGQGLSLNGTSQYATIPNSSSLSIAGNLTLSAWVNLTDYSSTADIIAKRSGNGATATNYELRIQQSTGLLQFLGYDGALKTLTGTTPVPTGSWAQVAAIKNGTTVTLYLNGVAIGSTGSVGTLSTNASPLRFGTADDTASFYKGGLDEIKIYNRALSPGELTADVAAVNAGIGSGQALPPVTPGVSQVATSDVVVRTDAGGYALAIAENQNLTHTDATTTIPSVTGTIASPAAWTEGTTKGLGFTLTNGTALEPGWGTSPNFGYAAIPLTATAFHTRSSYTGGTPDDTTMQYRLDAAATQKTGSYANTVTITATLKP